MKVAHVDQISADPVDMEGAAGCRMRMLIGPSDGAPHFSMRCFELDPGGHTPHHHHTHEHEVFVLDGDGTLQLGDKTVSLVPGTAVLVPGGLAHQFRNTGSAPLRFLCLVPHGQASGAASCVAACSCDG